MQMSKTPGRTRAGKHALELSGDGTTPPSSSTEAASSVEPAEHDPADEKQVISTPSSSALPGNDGEDLRHGREARQAILGEPTQGLQCRIDPKDLQVDWNTEAIADADDSGPVARLGRPPRSDFVRAHPLFKA